MSGTIRCQNSYNKKIIYLDSLRHFGRKDGQEIYRTLDEHGEDKNSQLVFTPAGYFYLLAEAPGTPNHPSDFGLSTAKYRTEIGLHIPG